MICNFSDPVNYLLETPESETEFFNFQKMTCEDGRLEFIQLQDDQFIYFDKTINIADLTIITLFIFLILSLIFAFIFNLVFPKFFRYINKKLR